MKDRLAITKNTVNPIVLPKFPAIPERLKKSRPDLTRDWQAFENDLEKWRQSAAFLLAQAFGVVSSVQVDPQLSPEALLGKIADLTSAVNSAAQNGSLNAQAVHDLQAAIDEINKLLTDLQVHVSSLAGEYFIHTQNSPDTTWVIPHNMDRVVTITCFDSNWTRFEGGADEQPPPFKSATIGFTSAVSGFAVCT